MPEWRRWFDSLFSAIVMPVVIVVTGVVSILIFFAVAVILFGLTT